MFVAKTIVVFGLMALVAVCDGHSFRFASCPKVKVMGDFDMSKFVGDWYVVGRFNPISTCVKLKIQKKEDNYTAQESTRPFGFNFGLDDHAPTERILKIISNTTDAVFKVSRKFPYTGLFTYGVIATDYDKYAVVWGCDSAVIGSLRNLDILSRKPDLELEDLKRAIDIAEKAGIDTRPLNNVDHSRCSKHGEKPDDSKDEFNNMYVK